MGFFNALMYSAPIFNIWPLARLVDRLEIQYNELDKTHYKESFTELVGECYDTIEFSAYLSKTKDGTLSLIFSFLPDLRCLHTVHCPILIFTAASSIP
jgi:hypothetical protein